MSKLTPAEIFERRRKLLGEIREIEALTAAKKEQEREAQIKEVFELMARYGLTVDDLKSSRYLRDRFDKTDGRAVVKPKYRDPISGLTWTGRGVTPVWLKNALAAGRSLDDYLI